MNEIEYAITNLEEFLEADIGQGDLHMCSAEAAMIALREKLERSKGCPVCDGKYADERVSDRYCNCCGRRLEVEHDG